MIRPIPDRQIDHNDGGGRLETPVGREAWRIYPLAFVVIASLESDVVQSGRECDTPAARAVVSTHRCVEEVSPLLGCSVGVAGPLQFPID
jgi:hypothetical protein